MVICVASRIANHYIVVPAPRAEEQDGGISSTELRTLVREAVQTLCPTFEQPFEEARVTQWILNHASVAPWRGSERYDEVARDAPGEITEQLRGATDELGARRYLAGRGKAGRYVWYPVGVIRALAKGDETLSGKLMSALERQDAAYNPVGRGTTPDSRD